MTSEIVKIPTLESVTAEGYATVTVYLDFNFIYNELFDRLPCEGRDDETQEEFAERLKSMIEDAAHDEIESQFDGMGYRGGEPEVTSVEVQSVTVTESGIETFEEEIEKELEDV